MVSLDQIKELRDMTGVSMMSCKSALEEAQGNIEKAVEILRKKGEAKAASRSDRSTGEGGFFVKNAPGKVSLVSLRCETDFVSRSDDFMKYGQELAEGEFAGNFDTVSARLTDMGSKMGEKIEIPEHMSLESTVTGSYVHSNRKIATVVGLSGGTEEMARDVAMHVAGIAPKYIRPEEVDAALLASERDIWAEQLQKEGKPADIVEKIMIGKEKKFREEHALLTQPFVKDSEKTVGQYLGDVQVVKFYRGVI
ncbi:MAG: translation elongation factor Ts [Patescibacteria group bacterium]